MRASVLRRVSVGAVVLACRDAATAAKAARRAEVTRSVRTPSMGLISPGKGSVATLRRMENGRKRAPRVREMD